MISTCAKIVRKRMSNYEYYDVETIKEYLDEYKGLQSAISTLEDRMNTIDDILRNHHNFAIGTDRLINVVG
jgi:hypothetical protein